MSTRIALLAIALILASGCDSAGGGSDVSTSPDVSATPDVVGAARTLRFVGEVPQASPAGEPVPDMQIELLEDGEPVVDAELSFTVLRGGGAADASVTTDSDGRAAIAWTLGSAPVANELRVAFGEGEGASAVVQATREDTVAPTPFLDVNAYLTEEGIEGTTEDLAFDGEGHLLMGVPGGLLSIDAEGTPSLRALSGDPLVGPLGIAVDAEGAVWVADSDGSALRHVAVDGAVTTPLSDNGEEALQKPNYVAVGPEGWIYVTDPCLGEVIRFDPQTETVEVVLSFDLATEGGPNGLAFDEAGAELYVTTENTALLCGHADVGPLDEVAGLYAVPVAEGVVGARRTVATGVGLFADGLAFDAEGNLYVALDRAEGLALGESAVEVLPAGGDTLLPFLSASDRIFANVAFGTDAFGETTLYVALLTVTGFTDPAARGVERIDIGLRGLPLFGIGR